MQTQARLIQSSWAQHQNEVAWDRFLEMTDWTVFGPMLKEKRLNKSKTSCYSRLFASGSSLYEGMAACKLFEKRTAIQV
jgi:hypothetical protein